MKRIFIAIDIPQEFKKSLGQLAKEIKGIKWVTEENLHLTLFFFAAFNDREIEKLKRILSAALQGQKRFELKLQNIGAFPNPQRPKIIWVGIDNSSELRELYEVLKNKLVNRNLPFDQKKFTPHLTLARVKFLNSESQRFIAGLLKKFQSFSFGKFIVNSLVIYESILSETGPIYREIKKINLI